MTSAVAALAAIFVAGHAARAHAHGLVPAPQSILASDAKGVRAVRLTEGLALRTDRGFEYVCPAAWGGDYAFTLAAALPDGKIAVATGAGLAVRAEDGTFAESTDPLASGRVLAFAQTPQTLYALYQRGTTTELIAFGETRSHVAYDDSRGWSDVVASDGELLLVRFDGTSIHELRLSRDARSEEVIGQKRAEAPEGTAAVFARLAGGTSYVVAAVNGGLALDLGRIEDNAFHLLRTAGANVAGPLDTADGHRFVAIDGALARFDGDHLDELDEAASVTCLGRDGARSYACTRSEIRALDAGGLGATLFDITRLQDPDPSIVPEPLRSECGAQWDHFRFDLVASGVELTGPDAGTDADASTPSDAGANASDAGRSHMPSKRASKPHESGCAVVDAGPDAGPSLALAILALVLARRHQPRRR
jgi:MYXO-CTERM domain-containing protein